MLVDALEPCLVAEASHGGAHALEAAPGAFSGRSRCRRELAPEGNADVVQALSPVSVGHRVDEQSEQRLVAPSRKLDRVQLWNDRVRLGGPSGAGPVRPLRRS